MSTVETPVTPLIDGFGRQVTYVRLSVTDRCDFRCVYCMEEDMIFLPREKVLTLEEIALIADAFAQLGVNKIRLTGGEPLVRRNVMELIHHIGDLEQITDFAMTSNGSQLGRMAGDLKAAGLKRLNISLDSLDPVLFHQLTRKGDLNQVVAGIDAAVAAGFKGIKLNAVILKGRNDHEILDLLEFAIARDIDISYIEEMPLGEISEHQRDETYCSSDEVRETIAARYELLPTTEKTDGPSRYFRIPGLKTKVGFISPYSHNFCSSCNRVRVTAEGRLLLCLGNEHSVDLRAIIRANPGDIEPLKQAIRDSMAIKPERHHFTTDGDVQVVRFMNMTGG
ncbi:GTP 3',8-cyclase MoaA [Oceanospirillum linum]|uniref:GTP 3',8-cyclase n=1 Tax=Oceanospirillum linum TaxID=966 RepID=A0A1T1HCT8_OCELI|nr:GTP 3',8-cyclase MoaA [Oceanospirillum linum]OOV87669.1 cyclic pyranopterin phosphate synthase MoaA [Oceanospirillum linum]SEF95827.1 cyclic pyranopterin monophosphate synthase subunit MoaA [Oleiphilus messinensis]SMP11604.1 cyclic pyranopterin monophosphate synthase subunit MoaA [Oceanospirillum linum]